MTHELTLLRAEVCTLRKANKSLSKCRRAKKIRVREGDALTIKDGLDILTQKDAEEKVLHDKRLGKGAQNEGKSTSRRCGTCSGLIVF